VDDFKGILQSRTVWSGLAALIGVLMSAFGYTVTDADQTQIVEAVGNVVSVLGSLGAIYYRVKATKVIQ